MMLMVKWLESRKGRCREKEPLYHSLLLHGRGLSESHSKSVSEILLFLRLKLIVFFLSTISQERKEKGNEKRQRERLRRYTTTSNVFSLSLSRFEGSSSIYYFIYLASATRQQLLVGTPFSLCVPVFDLSKILISRRRLFSFVLHSE